VSLALRRAPAMSVPVGLSLLLHAAVFVPALLYRGGRAPALPPMYNVELVAAPKGEVQAGVVRDDPPPTPPPVETKAPPKAVTNPLEKVAPIKPPVRATKEPVQATPNVTKTPEKVATATAPTAGGGETGGAGTDVANVKTEGIDFPFPGYLQNIVRQVTINFKPRNPGALKAEVFFLIRRDGTVTGFRIVTSSGNYAFDLEAQGAIEAAQANFGPLPSGFADDILPVSFSFNPARIR
jgi:protein TonB